MTANKRLETRWLFCAHKVEVPLSIEYVLYVPTSCLPQQYTAYILPRAYGLHIGAAPPSGNRPATADSFPVIQTTCY
jgi:hypothetical protein